MKNSISLQFTIPDSHHQTRLDLALSQLDTTYSRAQYQTWIKEGMVSLNQKVETKPKKMVALNDTVTITATLPQAVTCEAQPIPLNIAYEDDALLIVNKPIGLIVHPGAGNPDRTLVNALLHYLPSLDTLPRAGIIHRLDKDTSGLLIVAKTLPAYHALIKAMQKRLIHREYRALVQGTLISGGMIDAPIGRHGTHRTKMTVTDDGKEAVTHYRVLERFPNHTLLSVVLETGRTHQIRVHLSHIGYPLVGDATYGKYRIFAGLSQETNEALRRFSHQALHAYCLTLPHPLTDEPIECTAPLPQDMEALLTQLRKQ